MTPVRFAKDKNATRGQCRGLGCGTGFQAHAGKDCVTVGAGGNRATTQSSAVKRFDPGDTRCVRDQTLQTRNSRLRFAARARARIASNHPQPGGQVIAR